MQGLADADKHAKRILRKSRASRKKGAKVKPKDFVKRIADMEDPHKVRMTLMARARAAQDYRQPYEDEWRQAFYAWMQILSTTSDEDKWRSKRFIPMIFQQIEAAHPSIVSAALGGKDIWKFYGETPEGEDNADAMHDLIHWQARGPSRIRWAYIRALWWSLVTGTGTLDHQWSYEVEDRLTPVIVDDVDDDGNRYDESGKMIDVDDTTTTVGKVKEIQKKTEVTQDYPIVKSLNPFDVWFPTTKDEGETSPKWVFIKHPTTVGKCIEAADKDGAHLDAKAVKDWVEACTAQGYDPTLEYDFLGGELDMTMYDDLLTEVDLQEREAPDDAEEGPIEDKRIILLVYRSESETITLAPGGRIIGWSENPYSHAKTGLVVHNHYEIPGSWYGRGLGTVLLPQQELVNVNINRAMDVAEISLMGPIGVDRSRVSVLDEKFRWQPNALIRTRGSPREAVHRLDLPPTTDHALTWDAHLKKDADDTTGFSEQARGVTPHGVNTATEFSGLQANIKTRTFMHVERLKDTLELSGNYLVSLNQQYMTVEQIVSVIGENGLFYRTINPLKILGGMTCHATVSASKMAPAMKVQQMISLTQVIVPLMQQGAVSSDPFVARWLRMILEEIEVDDLDRILPKNPDQWRSPQAENIALRKGVKIRPAMYEPHELHIASHSDEIEVVKQEIEEGQADESELARLMEHIQEHMTIAQQAGAMMAQQAGAGAPPRAPPGGTPDRQQAQGLGAAQGSNGVPGAASPGPGAPAGRPM